MKGTHANLGANRKNFMIRTSLRISTQRRNTTFANVFAVKKQADFFPFFHSGKEAVRRCPN
jgi:hypothetical protein